MAGLTAHVDVRDERATAAHLRQRLQERVAIPRGRREAARAQHPGIAIAEGEVGDLPLGVPERPQYPYRLGEAVEHREPSRAPHTEQLEQLAILSPGLRGDDVV